MKDEAEPILLYLSGPNSVAEGAPSSVSGRFGQNGLLVAADRGGGHLGCRRR